MREVYVQRNEGEKKFLSVNCFAAAGGFAQMGYKVNGFKESILEYLAEHKKINKKTIVVGGINTMRTAIKTQGVIPPAIDNPHTSLPEYIGRKMMEVSFKGIEEYAEKEQFPFFIKPLEDHKLFTGYVVKSKHDLLQAKLRTQPETKILMSECVDFISEYRCFVLDGKLVGSKNYTGDFRVIPDYDIVENAINDYQNQPVAYSIDFGVTSDGRTLLVEMNDAFGLSSYGLNNIIYCKMLEARWDEIMKNV